MVRSEMSTGKVSAPELDAALKELAGWMLAPRKPGRFPRPTAPVVHPVLKRRIITLKAFSPDEAFEGIIQVKQSFTDHIRIQVKGTQVDFVDADIQCMHNFGSARAITSSDSISVAGVIRKNSTTVVSSTLCPAAGLAPGGKTYVSYANGQISTGSVHVFPVTVDSDTHTLDVSIPTPGGINAGLGNVQLIKGTINAEGKFEAGVHQDVAISAGVTQYANVTFGADTTHIAFMYNPAVDILATGVGIGLSECSGATTSLVQTNLPMGDDTAWNAIINESRKVSISALDALLSFDGGATNQTGRMACALVPYGTPIPETPQAVIDMISRLPDVRSHEGKLGEGAHVSWLPDVLNQLWLRQFEDFTQENLESQVLLFAWVCAPAGSAQAPQVTLDVHANAEFENYNPVYSAQPCCSGGLLTEAVVNTWGSAQPCSGNPTHYAKIARNVKMVMNDPTVRMLGSLALKAGKVLGPTLLAAL